MKYIGAIKYMLFVDAITDVPFCKIIFLNMSSEVKLAFL